MQRFLLVVAALALTVVLGATVARAAALEVTLVNVDVVPALPQVPEGSSLQMTAVGTFSDGSNQDLTSAATWTSTNPAVAHVERRGEPRPRHGHPARLHRHLGERGGGSRLDHCHRGRRHGPTRHDPDLHAAPDDERDGRPVPVRRDRESGDVRVQPRPERLGRRAALPSRSPPGRTVFTPSRCGPSTQPATSIPRRRRSSGSSTRPAPRR